MLAALCVYCTLACVQGYCPGVGGSCAPAPLSSYSADGTCTPCPTGSKSLAPGATSSAACRDCKLLEPRTSYHHCCERLEVAAAAFSVETLYVKYFWLFVSNYLSRLSQESKFGRLHFFPPFAGRTQELSMLLLQATQVGAYQVERVFNALQASTSLLV